MVHMYILPYNPIFFTITRSMCIRCCVRRAGGPIGPIRSLRLRALRSLKDNATAIEWQAGVSLRRMQRIRRIGVTVTSDSDDEYVGAGHELAL